MRWPRLHLRAQVPAPAAAPTPSATPATPRCGWPWLIHEPFTGAWQQNREVAVPTLLANPTVFACITLIAQDISKLRPILTQRRDDVWIEVENSAYTPVLRRPNDYQNYIQFRFSWMCALLSKGNAYALKQRDGAGNVRAMYVIDPSSVEPMIAPNGNVYYRLRHTSQSSLYASSLPDWEDGSVMVPATEVIHDRINTLFHPLVGLSPLFAAALPALNALSIGNNAQSFWSNAARPSGILTAPGAISDETAKRLAEFWNSNFTGQNAGRVAVLGDNLKFEQMTMSAEDAQLIEQLKWSAETICSVFHMPAFKVGAGAMPTYQNGEILNSIYYTDCLQYLIESWEVCMDDGLSLGNDLAIELDTRQLLRMDTQTRFKSHTDAIAGGWMAPNEARQLENMQPVQGGDTPYMQQQNWPLSQLAKRPPPGTAPAPAPAPATPAADGT